MKKTFAALLVIVLIAFTSKFSNAQYYSPPSITLSIGGSLSKAGNDAYGRDITTLGTVTNAKTFDRNYGMNWGFGGYIRGKVGLRNERSHRLVLGIDYLKFSNSGFRNVNSPGTTYSTKTDYNLVTGSFGYEYNFNPAASIKPYVGAAFSATLINGKYTNEAGTVYTLLSTVRLGGKFSSGYEFTLNSDRSMGLNIGIAYTLHNLITDNNAPNDVTVKNEFNLNDGHGAGSPDYGRYIGTVSLDIGLTFYTGVKSYPKMMRGRSR